MKILFSKNSPRAVIRLFLVIGFYLVSIIQTNAQQKYPVTVNIAITPPYSAYLTDYISAGSNKLVANIVFNDYNEPSWNIYLRIKIESSNLRIKTRADFIPSKPITLTPGVPVQISGTQLYEYFDFNNIDVAGISKSELISNGRLIEGNYKFSVEVYDYNKRIPLSLESYAYANIVLNDPPQLVLPNDQSVVELNSQNINFQWQLSGGNITTTLYQLAIYELGDYNVNPSVAIKNNQAVKVFESEKLDNPLYLYNISSPLLQRGKKYAWLVQAITTNNRDEFKNQGFSQIRCFYYGYPEGGKIGLNTPENNHFFSLRESKTFRWDSPNNLTPNQQYYYDFKIVQVNENQLLEDAINNNNSVFTKQSEILTARNSGYEETVSKNLFDSNKQYAWQVKAHTKDQTIASSPIYSCFGPPLIEAFYAGNHTVYVTNTSSSNINDLTGEGEVQISYNGATQKVFFEHIKIERQGALLIMTKGHVKAKYNGKAVPLKADYTPNGNAIFEPDSLDIDKEYMRLKGMVNWKFPHATITPQNAYVQSKPTWVIFENYQLIGRTYVKDSLNYELADPYGFKISLENTSYFLLLNNNNFKLNFNGKTTLPKNVKNSSGTNVILPFINTDKLDYIIQRTNPGSSAIELVKGTGIDLIASSYIIDLSESTSPYKKSGQKYWKGVYLIRSQLEFPVTPDKSDQLFLKKTFQYTLNDTLNSNDTCWITTTGLQLKVNNKVEHLDSLWFNTFPGVVNSYLFNITNSTLVKGLFKGNIAIPLLSEKERFPFTIPLTINGFATGYLDQSLNGLAIAFNPDGGEQKIDLTINRAVFANKQRLDMNIDLKWSFLNIDIKSFEGFKVWGNGNIGFLTPNGSASLTSQIQTKIKGFEANIDYIGCGRQGNLYAFGTSAKVVMAEDVSGPNGAPIANIYSITKNSLLNGGTSFSSFPETFQNILTESTHSKTEGNSTAGLSQGKSTQNDSLKVVFGEEVNQEVASMLNNLNTGEKTDIDSSLYSITQTSTSEKNTSPTIEGEVTIEQVISLIDVVSPFLNDEQRKRAEDFKSKISEFNNSELVILYKELKELDQFIKKTAKDILQNLVNRIKEPIIEQSNTIKEKVVGFIDNKRDNLLSAIDGKINTLIDELAKKATNAFSPSDLAGKESIIAEIISSTAEATKVGITAEINRSVSASVKKNITDKVIGIIDTAIVYNVTSFIDSTLLRTGNAIIEKGVNADLRLDQIGQNAKSLLPTIGKDLSNRILAINFENTITATITDAYTGIRWDSIGNYIAEQVLTELIAKKLMDAVTTTVVNTVTDLLGEDGGAVAGALLNNVNFDFSNLGDKLKNGEFDKIIKFDPSYIKVKTSVAEFEGWTKFTDKDPLWGDSWQASLSAKITTGFCFKASAKYINGTTTASTSNYKYWFLEIGVDDLGIPLGAMPLTLNGAKGKIFHHMKRVSDGVYQPAESVKFGAGVQLFFYDTPTSSAILAFDVSTDITILDGGFIFEMSGNAYVANLTVTVKGRKIISRYLAGATGYICYNSVENHLVGLFEAHTNTSPLLCIGGELSVDIGKGHWSVAVGTREKPLFVDVLCLNKPIFKGWFAINNNGLDLGLMTSIHVKVSSPWIGFSGFKVKPWAEFKFDFGATAIILWKPNFEIPEAHVWLELYAGIGIKYKFLFSSGNLTIAAVNVGGEVMFSTTPDAYIEGKIKGKVTVFNIGVGFNLDLKYNFA